MILLHKGLGVADAVKAFQEYKGCSRGKLAVDIIVALFSLGIVSIWMNEY